MYEVDWYDVSCMTELCTDRTFITRKYIQYFSHVSLADKNEMITQREKLSNSLLYTFECFCYPTGKSSDSDIYL